jgi:hypothetical protein
MFITPPDLEEQIKRAERAVPSLVDDCKPPQKMGGVPKAAMAMMGVYASFCLASNVVACRHEIEQSARYAISNFVRQAVSFKITPKQFDGP